MFKKLITDKIGFTLIELISAMFIISIVIIPMMKAFSYSLSYMRSTTYSSMALALAQEGLEKIRYERDKFVRNNAISGWENFYERLAFKEQTGEQLNDNFGIDLSSYDTDPCSIDKKIRFINKIGDEEQSENYRPISKKEYNGRFVIFTDEEDVERIHMTLNEEGSEPIEFTRKITCKKIGDRYERSEGDVLEFVVQIGWDYKGVEYSLPIKIELAKQEKQ